MTCFWEGRCREACLLWTVSWLESTCVPVLRVPVDRYRGCCVCSETSAEGISFFKILMLIFGGFPGSSAGKESACNAGDPSSVPGSRRSAGEGIGYPLQYSWASLVAQLADKKSSCNAGHLGSVPGLGRSPGDENGYPLQYSGLENSMDSTGRKESDTREWLSLSLDFIFSFRLTETSSVSVCNCSNRTGEHRLVRAPWRLCTPRSHLMACLMHRQIFGMLSLWDMVWEESHNNYLGVKKVNGNSLSVCV